MERNRECPACGRTFTSTHGGQVYCLDSDCSLETKLKRQSINYVIGDDAKKAIQKNRKILTDILLDDEYREIDLKTVLKLGFDQNGFYGMRMVENPKRHFFFVHDLCFHITSTKHQKIQVWKISNT